jgi:hypothetical protein
MKITTAVLAATAALTIASAGAASAAAPDRAITQSGGAAGLVAAVVQTGDIKVVEVGDVTLEDVVTVGDVTVQVENILNRNQVVKNVLNNNNVTVTDVVDVAIVDNVLVLIVDVL